MYSQVKGIWATPSYVHMSGGWRRKSQSQQAGGNVGITSYTIITY